MVRIYHPQRRGHQGLGAWQMQVQATWPLQEPCVWTLEEAEEVFILYNYTYIYIYIICIVHYIYIWLYIYDYIYDYIYICNIIYVILYTYIIHTIYIYLKEPSNFSHLTTAVTAGFPGIQLPEDPVEAHAKYVKLRPGQGIGGWIVDL